MSKRVRRRRGTRAEHDEFTGADSEITVNTTDYRVHVHDGATAGGVTTAREDEVLRKDQNLSDVDSASTARGNLGFGTDNWTATAEPTVNDDNTAGYAVGSRWYYAGGSPHVQWICTDASTGAADWVPVSTVPVEQWVRLEQKVADNDSQVDFAMDVNNYDQFRVVIRGASYGGTGDLVARLSSDGGSTFRSSTYRWSQRTLLAGAFNDNNNDASINLSGASSFFTYWGDVTILHVGEDAVDTPRIQSSIQSGRNHWFTAGDNSEEKQFNAIRLYSPESDIVSGRFILYGWKDGS